MDEKYTLSKKMKGVINLAQKFTSFDVDTLTPTQIQEINQRSFPNGRVVRKLLGKPSGNITRSTYIIPVNDGSITAYYYSQKGNESMTGLQPLIIFYHGGGWIFGNLHLYDLFLQNLAHVTGACVLAPDYRLAPQYKFPTAVEDCFDVYKWATEGVKYWKVDPDRIYVAGDSAGGNLAAVVAGLARDRKAASIEGQILLYPMTDGRLRTQSFDTYSDSPTLTSKQMNFYIKQYQREPKDILSPYFSPLLSQNLSLLPKALIITAEFDPLKDDGSLYAEALNKNESEAICLEVKETVHGFINYPHATGYKEVISAIKQFIYGKPLNKIQLITEDKLKKQENRKF